MAFAVQALSSQLHSCCFVSWSLSLSRISANNNKASYGKPPHSHTSVRRQMKKNERFVSRFVAVIHITHSREYKRIIKRLGSNLSHTHTHTLSQRSSLLMYLALSVSAQSLRLPRRSRAGTHNSSRFSPTESSFSNVKRKKKNQHQMNITTS